MKYLLPFSKVTKDDVALVGGKGANLGEMARAGFPVPPGYIATSEAYFEFLKSSGLQQKISELLQKLDVEKTSELNEAAHLIQQAITRSKIPLEIDAEIRVAYHDLGQGKPVAVAIRSSSTGEDLGDATAAGQQSTYLNVTGPDEVTEKVKSVWASLFNARAIYYRKQKNISLDHAGIAVPMQIMVESEVSGVSFSIVPVTNDKGVIVVEAVYGLGELIVQGAVTPDHFEFDKKNLAVTYQQIGLQDKQMI